MNTHPHQLVGDPFPERNVLWPCAAVVAILIALAFYFSIPWYGVVLPLVASLFFFGGFIRRVTVDYKVKVVRDDFLFHQRLLRRREFPFSEFDAVTYDYRPGSDAVCYIGLRHKDGRVLWIRTFQGQFGRYQEEFAWRLSCDTGIEIDEYPAQP